MIKNFIFLLAIVFLLLLILLALFPSSFTETTLTETSIQSMPPNRGLNKIELTNLHEHIIYIEDVLFNFYRNRELKNTYTVFDDLLTKPEQKVVYYLCGNEISGANRLTIALNGSNLTEEVIRLEINGNEVELLRDIRSKDDLESTSLSIHDSNLRVNSFFGTDTIGRDVWTRFVFGTGIILKICFFSFLISLPIGVIFGLIHGYSKKHIKYLMDGICDMFNSFPIYLVAMLFVGAFGEKFIVMIIVFSSIQWIEIERIIYEEVQKQKNNDFIKSSKIFGRPRLKILFIDILLLCVPHIIVGGVFFFKRMILVESTLSYLGYSVTIPYSSWGNIMMEIHGLRIFSPVSGWWWIVLLPSLGIILTVLSLNVIESRLKEWLNVGN